MFRALMAAAIMSVVLPALAFHMQVTELKQSVARLHTDITHAQEAPQTVALSIHTGS